MFAFFTKRRCEEANNRQRERVSSENKLLTISIVYNKKIDEINGREKKRKEM